MWRFFARLFMVIGILSFIGSLMYLWGFFVGSAKTEVLDIFFLHFLMQLTLSAVLFALGDLMLRIESNERTIKRFLDKMFDIKGE